MIWNLIKYSLDSVTWDFRTGLLHNIFPVSELKEPSGKCKITLIAFAPISANGKIRSRALVYGLLLQNPNQTGKPLELMLPISDSGKSLVKVNGQILKIWQKVDYLEGPAASFKTEVPANGSVKIEILN